jgi:hypothetical protein
MVAPQDGVKPLIRDESSGMHHRLATMPPRKDPATKRCKAECWGTLRS